MVGSSPFTDKYFVNSANSVKTFRKNSNFDIYLSIFCFNLGKITNT